ncbi:alpha/beta fold hydrolase [Stackebrandtia nassauensis]|uniref:Alpha/beta hydrolase fold protein n=1 Tax=Stackebrandtia nassauensis (strain DSM 44728 / CIP 108903 / NRRL B-16338 / NBRC 102104 / LLR-40K-21) TaxID=446470 RepID=D3PV31_STANL|nr:alpha/beta fold hydrolase [Stackebrandtia nassauensis]ADD41084.1 alpha/beta hydrolase fold protein [Stackebrandtia nassauensis DSM 44728]
MTERMIDVDGTTLCTESFGDPANPPLLLIAGTGSSMLWWEAELCSTLADEGRFVIRYDHRDTGRSTTSPPGHPDYTGDDMITDAVGVLTAYDIPAAHVVGVSAGGGIAQLLTLDHPERVLSLTLISTTSALSSTHALPGPSEEFIRFVSTATVDWADSASVVEYLVDYCRVLAGETRPFDETPWRNLVQGDVDRAHDIAAIQNHDILQQKSRADQSLSSITAPTLVLHGTADPMFPFPHGEALRAAIPGAELVALRGAGHGVDRADWETITHTVIKHSA